MDRRREAPGFGIRYVPAMRCREWRPHRTDRGAGLRAAGAPIGRAAGGQQRDIGAVGGRPEGVVDPGALSVERVTICDARSGVKSPDPDSMTLGLGADWSTLFNAKRLRSMRVVSDFAPVRSTGTAPPPSAASSRPPRAAELQPGSHARTTRPHWPRAPPATARPGSRDAPPVIGRPRLGRGRNNIQSRGILCNRSCAAPGRRQPPLPGQLLVGHVVPLVHRPDRQVGRRSPTTSRPARMYMVTL